jgi:hypothetical protein
MKLETLKKRYEKNFQKLLKARTPETKARYAKIEKRLSLINNQILKRKGWL